MKQFLITSTCVLLLSVSSQAQTLFGFDTTGNTATVTGMPSPWTPQTLAENINIVSGLTRGEGLTVGSGGANVWYGSTWSKDADSATARANAIASGDYFSVSVQAAEGFALSFSSLDAVNYRTQAGANHYVWQYQVGDGDFFDIGSVVTFTNTSTINNSAAPSIDLSTIAALQNVSDVVTFRMVGWTSPIGALDPSGSGNLGFGNVTGNELAFSGSVTAVPEPSTYTMLFLGVVFIAWKLRRKRAKV